MVTPAQIRSGQRTALARAITLIESQRPSDQQEAQALLSALRPSFGKALRIGISGPPGAGKSTLIDRLGMHLIAQGKRVAVLTIDPSSSKSGGSLLGDRTRMESLAKRPDAFVRSTPASGTLGGIGRRTREAMLLCEAAGYDVVLIETVGVGQSEVDIAELVDVVLLLVTPGGGDQLQGIKRGIMEVADVLVVSQADGERASLAEKTRADYEAAVRWLRHGGAAEVPVLCCSAHESRGLDGLWDALRSRHQRLREGGELDKRRGRQAVAWLHRVVHEGVMLRLQHHPQAKAALERAEREVAVGSITVSAAADRVVALLFDTASVSSP